MFKDPEILCWDVRNLGTVLHVIKRSVNTNQRIYFDISPDGKYLVTGCHEGLISFYDLSVADALPAETLLSPLTLFKAHKDCVNGVR